MIFQLTGLSGAGKTSIANEVNDMLAGNYSVEIIDGDEVRKTLSKGLGFNRIDRCAHIRRMHRMAMNSKAQIVIISAINPYDSVRNEILSKIIYIRCPLDVIKARDVKGLYRLGILPDGLQYEEPINADLVIDTDRETLMASAERVYDFIIKQIT